LSKRRIVVGHLIRRRWHGPHWRHLLLIGFVLLIGFSIVGAGVVAGLQHGLEARRTARKMEAARHYRLGVVALTEGKRSLAAAEFRRVLELEPNDEEARQQLRHLLAITPVRPSPTPLPKQVEQTVLAQLLQQAEASYASGDLVKASQQLQQIYEAAPNFQPEPVARLGYKIAFRQGMDNVKRGEMELAIRSFQEALRWQPDDPAATKQLSLASRYQQGLLYWYADWEKGIEIFSNLYREAPHYRDVADRLLEALIKGGRQAMQRKQYCLADKHLQAALQLHQDQMLRQEAEQAHDLCIHPPTATPTKTPTVTATQLTATPAPTVTPSPTPRTTVSATPTATATPTVATKSGVTPTRTATAMATKTPTLASTPTNTPTLPATPTTTAPTATPTPLPPTATPTVPPTATPHPTATPTPIPTATAVLPTPTRTNNG